MNPVFSPSFTLGRMLDRLNSAKDTLSDVDKASIVYTTAFGVHCTGTDPSNALPHNLLARSCIESGYSPPVLVVLL